MYKIRKITFVDHPILKNLFLDFCDIDNNAVDTVIIAGENGCGKSTILESLYAIVCGKADFESDVEIEFNGHIVTLFLRYRVGASGKRYLWAKDEDGLNAITGNSEFLQKYPLNGIYSDVDINFHSQNISTVTSLVLDSGKESRRSSTNLPKEIKQLLVDIQALDDAELSKAYREAKTQGKSTDELLAQERMPRFTTAFTRMFEDLTYSRVENTGSYKEILFKKNGIEIPIDALSSGEKQVVYRGCFLLKDTNAMTGASIFIDEPEISLHPTWQQKIMDYYKGIFTNEDGVQTSQIFAVTHSPFIIHNENRKNDKVIVLSRDKDGNIIVKDSPEYYECKSVEAVRDAFCIQGFSAGQPVVYLEGRTDKLYFDKALEVFGYKDCPFEFRWIGHMKDGQEANTGKDALNKAVQFLLGQNLPVKHICLFDCDTRKQEFSQGNIYVRTMPTFENAQRMKKGIENALVLNTVDLSKFYLEKTKEGDYGDSSIIREFQKMDFCQSILKKDTEELKIIFAHLKEEIDCLITIFNS